MAKRVSVDRVLFIVTLLLVFVGLVMVFSASAVMAKEKYHSGYFFLLRQMGWAIGGFIALMIGMRLDYKRLKHPGVVFTMLGVTTLMLILVFFLDRSHNTHRWIHFGGFSFQPSELAKPVLILFLAFFLENRTKSMDDWRNTLIPAVIPTMVFLGLIVFQPDLGTAIACAAVTACILFVAGLNLKYLGYGILASLLPLYFLIFHVAYRRDRILAFLNPYSDPQGRGFHIIQSLIAVSTCLSRTRTLFSPCLGKNWDWLAASSWCCCLRPFSGAEFGRRCTRKTCSVDFLRSVSPAWSWSRRLLTSAWC
jgi:cell division protein FtsW